MNKISRDSYHYLYTDNRGRLCVGEGYTTVPRIRHIVEGMRGNNHVVTVVFEDGSHILKECSPEDNYDLNVGVALCLADKLLGSTSQFHKEVKRKLAVKKAKKDKEAIEKSTDK